MPENIFSIREADVRQFAPLHRVSGDSENVELRNVKSFSCEGWSDGLKAQTLEQIQSFRNVSAFFTGMSSNKMQKALDI